MQFENILYTADDRVAVITLNRPERMNALTRPLMAEFSTALEMAEKDETVRVIVVTGAGERAWSSGFDLKASVGRPPRTPADQSWAVHSALDFNLSVWRCSKPTIALINGYCLAGAFEFAQCFDIRYCSTDAQFGVLESRFGGGVATMMLPWLAGLRSKELVLTGDMFGAEDAHRLGIVDRIFPKATVVQDGMKAAKKISRVALSVLQWNKRAINQAFETMGLYAALRSGGDAATMIRLVGSPERDMFDELRNTKGLDEALKWRKGLFAEFE